MPFENKLALVLLLGQRDQPTDGVEDYCVFLAEALGRRAVSAEVVRVPWAERGWFGAYAWLRNESARWKGSTVLVQYTALGWSRRGFPLGFLPILSILRRRRIPLAIVFHDAVAYPGNRWIDHVRRAVQEIVMRKALASVKRAIIPASPENLPWMRGGQEKIAFIPVGSNIPSPSDRDGNRVGSRPDDTETPKIVAVFGITPGAAGEREMKEIREVLQAAARSVPRIQLCAVGRGTREAEPQLRALFEGTGIALSVFGVMRAEQLGEILSRADAQVDVRARISSRRGSVIAGIVCGTPVVGFESADTDDAIRAAGVQLVPPGDKEAFAAAVTRILCDGTLRDNLRQRNRIASAKYFSWDAVAERLLAALQISEASAKA